MQIYTPGSTWRTPRIRDSGGREENLAGIAAASRLPRVSAITANCHRDGFLGNCGRRPGPTLPLARQVAGHHEENPASGCHQSNGMEGLLQRQIINAAMEQSVCER